MSERSDGLAVFANSFRQADPFAPDPFAPRSPKIARVVKSVRLLRESLGPDIDIAVDFPAKTSPSVAAIIVKEVEPLNPIFIEEP